MGTISFIPAGTDLGYRVSSAKHSALGWRKQSVEKHANLQIWTTTSQKLSATSCSPNTRKCYWKSVAKRCFGNPDKTIRKAIKQRKAIRPFQNPRKPYVTPLQILKKLSKPRNDLRHKNATTCQTNQNKTTFFKTLKKKTFKKANTKTWKDLITSSTKQKFKIMPLLTLSIKTQNANPSKNI